jgi:hypothetical protein
MTEVVYALWETSSGNLVGTYSTKLAALHVMESGIKKHGTKYADTFLLESETDGASKVLAEGEALVALIRSELANSPD